MAYRNKESKGWKSWGGILAFLAFFGSKFKMIVPLLKLGKFGGTIWSMALMMGAYAMIYPWSFSIGIVVMIFIHEMGHILAAKRKGIPVSAPAFIPFLGALITMKQQPLDAEDEAYLAYGGPLIGTIGALGAFALSVVLESPALLSVAQLGFFLNLINLVPIHPLDGGRIVTAISRWLWLVGLIGGLLVILYFKAIIFLLIWGMFAWELYKKYVRKDKQIETIQKTTLVISTTPDKFIDRGVPIPAVSHHRALFFVQMCNLRTQVEEVAIYYPGLGHVVTLPFDLGLMKSLTLINAKQEVDIVEMRLLVQYEAYSEKKSTVFQSEEYYQVAPKTRFIYGVAYFGLAAFLGWMMSVTYSMLELPAVVGMIHSLSFV